MKLLLTAARNNSLLSPLKSIPIAVALVAVITSSGLYLAYRSFDAGLKAYETQYATPKLDGSTKFSSHGVGTYVYLGNRYKIISILLLILLALMLIHIRFGESVKAKMIVGFANFLLSGLILNQLSWIFAEKRLRFEETSLQLPIDLPLRDSILYDWICLIAVVLLLLVQTFAAIGRFGISSGRQRQ